MPQQKIEVLTKSDLKNLSVVHHEELEILDWWLYDTLTIKTGGTQTIFRYFQQAAGQGSSITAEQTNMELPGQLSASYKFVCQKIIATPRQDLAYDVASALDALAVSQRGSVVFKIGKAPYAEIPMANLVGGNMQGVAAGGTEFAPLFPRTVVNGEFEYSPVIPANFTFSVIVTFPVAPTLNADIDLQIQMVGKMIRPMQA